MGTASGLRPNGIFRLNMDMNYDCTYYDNGKPVWLSYWQTLDIDFNSIDDVFYVELSGNCSGKLPCYSSIQGAVEAAGNFGTLQVTGESYHEHLDIQRSRKLILKGGYDSAFTSQSSYTRLKSLNISSGQVVADRLMLQ